MGGRDWAILVIVICSVGQLFISFVILGISKKIRGYAERIERENRFR